MQALKIILIGDTGVGKSQLSRCLMNKEFQEDTQSTIGMEFQSKKFDFEKCVVTSQIWDTAGQERFAGMTRAYYRDAVAAILVYDVCNRDSLIRLETVWLPQVKEFGHPAIKIVLVGNKCDKVLNGKCARDVLVADGVAFAERHNVDFLEASALSRHNVERMFRRVSLSVAKLLPDIKQHLELLDLPEGWLAIMPPPPPELIRHASSSSSELNGSVGQSPASSLENSLKPVSKVSSFTDSPESFKPIGIDGSSVARRRSMRKEPGGSSPVTTKPVHVVPRVVYINYWTGEEVDERPSAPADPGLLYMQQDKVMPAQASPDANDILRSSLDNDMPVTERSSSARTISLQPDPVDRRKKRSGCCVIL